MVEWQELVEIAVRPTASDALKGLGEPGERIDAIHLGGLQECGDRCPGPPDEALMRQVAGHIDILVQEEEQ